MYSRIKPLLCLALVTALLTVPSMGFAALHLVIQATGSNQGPIPGDSTVPGYQDAITLASFQHGVGLVDDALGAKMPMTLLRYELVGVYVTSVSESAGT